MKWLKSYEQFNQYRQNEQLLNKNGRNEEHYIVHMSEAGQIGPKPNRPQVKSAPILLFTIVNMQS